MTLAARAKWTEENTDVQMENAFFYVRPDSISERFGLKTYVQPFKGIISPLQTALYTCHTRHWGLKSFMCTQLRKTLHPKASLSPRLAETRLTRRAAAKKCEGAACQGRREEATYVRCGTRPGSHARVLGAWTHHHRAEVS